MLQLRHRNRNDCRSESTGYDYPSTLPIASNSPTEGPPLPDSRSSSNPHRRTRRDHTSETAEDYVEAVADIHATLGSCRVADLARRFAVSHVTVTRIVATTL